MAIQFKSFGQMAAHLVRAELTMHAELKSGLRHIAALIEKTAKGEIGHYQEEVGPFPAWEELSDSTEARKARMGYPPDAPLLATGEMRDSIDYVVQDLTAVIGSTDPVMEFHEFGTSKMPARPVMGPAAYSNKAAIQRILGFAVVKGLVGGSQIHAALGYDFETR